MRSTVYDPIRREIIWLLCPRCGALVPRIGHATLSQLIQARCCEVPRTTKFMRFAQQTLATCTGYADLDHSGETIPDSVTAHYSKLP